MKVCVIGTGYVGLVTGTCLAEIGNEVSCVDIDVEKVKKLQSGEITIYEPDLGKLFQNSIKRNRLKFTTDLSSGVKDAEVIFLALPTPQSDDGSAELKYILGVAGDLGHILEDYAVIIDKSTVPVGTTGKVRDYISKNAKVDFDVISNPEFLREGHAVNDFMNPDRIVIGSSSDRANKLIEELYEPFVRQGYPLLIMDEKSAEMTKYAANSFLASKISFMNEIANLCELLDADVDAVRLGIGADPRIGSRFLYPGIGYGGSCFPKDVKALSKTAEDNNYEFKILKAVEEVNNLQKKLIVKKIQSYYKNDLNGKTFALWGLAFKPDTDDIREAPSLEIIEELTNLGANIVAFDPEASSNVAKKIFDNKQIKFVEDKYNALEYADALIIATEWPEFETPDFEKVKKLLTAPVIFDGRNLYDPTKMKEYGFYYDSVGRRTVNMRTANA
jgi:UDPglucose 6-dehydrogenase